MPKAMPIPIPMAILFIIAPTAIPLPVYFLLPNAISKHLTCQIGAIGIFTFPSVFLNYPLQQVCPQKVALPSTRQFRGTESGIYERKDGELPNFRLPTLRLPTLRLPVHRPRLPRQLLRQTLNSLTRFF